MLHTKPNAKTAQSVDTHAAWHINTRNAWSTSEERVRIKSSEVDSAKEEGRL